MCKKEVVPVLNDLSYAFCDFFDRNKTCFTLCQYCIGVLMFSSFFLSHCKDSISAPYQTNTFRSFTQRRNLYLEEQRKVGVHDFRNHITSCKDSARQKPPLLHTRALFTYFSNFRGPAGLGLLKPIVTVTEFVKMTLVCRHGPPRAFSVSALSPQT